MERILEASEPEVEEKMERSRGEWKRSRFLLRWTDCLCSKPITSWMLELSEKKDFASSWVRLVDPLDVPWPPAIFELVFKMLN